uniref:Activin types I and II receptor domain-containing protein n=1 Tax=Caenorhabditis japonica TaxID=281687 RepID=A0A8R1DK69_CAEJA
MLTTSFSAIFTIIFLVTVRQEVDAIQCHTGLKFIKGTSVGTATVNCENSAAYCYNMTASTAALIEVTKAGCSMWRCMFAQNKCIGTTFQNIPISLCCCNTPLCNAGGEGGGNQEQIQSQNSGGWNAEPDHSRTNLRKEEVQSRFDSVELDDDHHQHDGSSRAARFVTPSDSVDTLESASEPPLEDLKNGNFTEVLDCDEEVDIPLI